jgi:hypothetical protein
MKALWTTTAAMLSVVGLVFGTAKYIESRNNAVERAVVSSLKQYEQAKRIEYLLHLLEAYRYRQSKSQSQEERDRWQKKIDAAMQEIEGMGRVRR